MSTRLKDTPISATPPTPEKASITLPATVEKVIKGVHPNQPDKAQLVVEGADHLYREIRIENTLRDKDGEKVALKPGAEVEVTVEATPEATIAKEATQA